MVFCISLFSLQIDNFESLYAEIEELKNVEVFDKWFQLDILPFKVSLLNVVSKWSLMFKEYLLKHVTERFAKVNYIVNSFLTFFFFRY